MSLVWELSGHMSLDNCGLIHKTWYFIGQIEDKEDELKYFSVFISPQHSLSVSFNNQLCFISSPVDL